MGRELALVGGTFDVFIQSGVLDMCQAIVTRVALRAHNVNQTHLRCAKKSPKTWLNAPSTAEFEKVWNDVRSGNATLSD